MIICIHVGGLVSAFVIHKHKTSKSSCTTSNSGCTFSLLSLTMHLQSYTFVSKSLSLNNYISCWLQFSTLITTTQLYKHTIPPSTTSVMTAIRSITIPSIGRHLTLQPPTSTPFLWRSRSSRWDPPISSRVITMASNVKTVSGSVLTSHTAKGCHQV